MLKKIIVSSVTFISSISVAYAGFYMGPTIIYESISGHHDVNYRDIKPKLSVGYAKEMPDDYYLAGEIFLGPKSITIHNESNEFGSLKTSYSYGASIIPGYHFDDVVLGFLRLGIIATRFTDESTVRPGAQAGAGLETNLTGNWFIRAEYDYVFYKTIDDLGNPHANQFGLGFMYRYS